MCVTNDNIILQINCYCSLFRHCQLLFFCTALIPVLPLQSCRSILILSSVPNDIVHLYLICLSFFYAFGHLVPIKFRPHQLELDLFFVIYTYRNAEIIYIMQHTLSTTFILQNSLSVTEYARHTKKVLSQFRYLKCNGGGAFSSSDLRAILLHCYI